MQKIFATVFAGQNVLGSRDPARFRIGGGLTSLAKRLECGAFTAALLLQTGRLLVL